MRLTPPCERVMKSNPHDTVGDELDQALYGKKKPQAFLLKLIFCLPVVCRQHVNVVSHQTSLDLNRELGSVSFID